MDDSHSHSQTLAVKRENVKLRVYTLEIIAVKK